MNSQKSLMQQHYRTVHLKKPFVCRVCGKECTYKKTRDKHEKESHGQVFEHPSDNEDMGGDFDETDTDGSGSSCQSKPVKVKQKPVVFKYNCEKCTFGTDDKTGFSAHVASHLEVKPFLCSFCKKSFVKQSGLTKHIGICDAAQQQMNIRQQKQQMSSSGDSVTQVKPPLSSPPALFQCSVTTCGKVFTSQDKYREHFKTMHVDPLGDGVFYCEVCIYRFFTKSGFGLHMHTHGDG